MGRMRGRKAGLANAKRCGHAWCSDCHKKRGRNRGNRRIRRAIKTYLHRINYNE